MIEPLGFCLGMTQIFLQIDSSGGENDEVYQKVERPQVQAEVRQFNGARAGYKSDSSPDSDSEGDSHHKRLLKRLEK